MSDLPPDVRSWLRPAPAERAQAMALAVAAAGLGWAVVAAFVIAVVSVIAEGSGVRTFARWMVLPCSWLFAIALGCWCFGLWREGRLGWAVGCGAAALVLAAAGVLGAIALAAAG